MTRLRVAIGCQGAGSHAAFAAGVLLQLLSPERRDRFELTALSGASGGALSAALAWRGLVSSGPEEARQRLLDFWRALEPKDPVSAWLAFLDVWLSRMPGIRNVPPYLAEPVTEPALRAVLRSHLDLERLTSDPARRSRPKLFVGATDVLNGNRVIFQGEALTEDHLIASAAVPPLFRAVKADGHLCWDGLFTTNPPVREFTDVREPPDEIWIVQLNPQRRVREPRSMREVKDRSNELSGNLSLGQELYFIDRINHLREQHESLKSRYRHIRLRLVALDSEQLDYPTKLERGRGFIESLLEAGRQRADWFFDERSRWPREGTVPAKSVLVTGAPAAPANGRSRASNHGGWARP